jgi:branched-chain amino acid aminotransferase
MAGTEGWAVIDGRGTPLAEAALPLTDPGYLYGWVAFETLDAAPGLDPAPNLARLAASSAALGIAMPPEDVLRADIEAVRVALGGRAWVRVDLTGGGRRLVWGTRPDPARPGHGVRCGRAPHLDHPLLAGSVKHRSRAPWIAEVRRRGVDELLFVDADGRFTEGTSCAIVAVEAGALVTAPWDGRILASTTLASLLDDAARLGIPVRREGPRAEGPWDGLYVASTTRVLAPVVTLDGAALAGWEPVGRALVSSRRTP